MIVRKRPSFLTVAARIGMCSGGSGTVEQNVGERQVSEEEGNGRQAGGQHPRMSNQSMRSEEHTSEPPVTDVARMPASAWKKKHHIKLSDFFRLPPNAKHRLCDS